jgi:hypothetical protein
MTRPPSRVQRQRGLRRIRWRATISFYSRQLSMIFARRHSSAPASAAFGWREAWRPRRAFRWGRGSPAIAVLHPGSAPSASPQGSSHRALAAAGAAWVAGENDGHPWNWTVPSPFPVRNVVIAALSSLRKGEVVAINAIISTAFRSSTTIACCEERQIRSVANMTRADARDFSNCR